MLKSYSNKEKLKRVKKNNSFLVGGVNAILGVALLSQTADAIKQYSKT